MIVTFGETCSGNSSQVTYESFLWIQGGKSWSLVNWPSDGMEMGKIFMLLFEITLSFLSLIFWNWSFSKQSLSRCSVILSYRWTNLRLYICLLTILFFVESRNKSLLCLVQLVKEETERLSSTGWNELDKAERTTGYWVLRQGLSWIFIYLKQLATNCWFWI